MLWHVTGIPPWYTWPKKKTQIVYNSPSKTHGKQSETHSN